MALLKYDFAVVGSRTVDRAFASIESRATRHNQKMAAAFGGRTTGRQPNINAAAKAAERLQRQATMQRLRDERALQVAQTKTARDKERALIKYQRAQAKQRQMDIRFARMQRREAAKAAAAAMRERQRTSKAIYGQVSGSARGALRVAGGTALTAVGIGGSLAMGTAVSQQMRETAMASNLANQGGNPHMKRALLRESQTVRGYTGEETLGAMTSFVDLTGDLETARHLMKELGQLSLATGSNFEDVSSAAGNFANNLKGIKDPAKRSAAIMQAMRALAGQGMAGAIELKDLAGGGASLGASATQYAGDKALNIKKAGVLAQAARATGGAESAEQAMTALARFTDQVSAKSKVLEKMGVNVGTRDADGNLTKLADPRMLVADIMDATGGDLAKLGSTFGARGKKVLQGFSDSYQSNGRQGVLAQFDKLMKTELSRQDITQRASSRLDDPDIRFKEVLRDFNSTAGEQLLPVITDLLAEFTKLMPAVATSTRLFASLVKSLSDNPLTTVGGIIAAKIAADIAMARIGDATRTALTCAISGASAAAPGTSGAGLAGGLLGAGAIGLTLGGTAALAIYASGVTHFEAGEVRMTKSGELLNKTRALTSAADLPQARKNLEEQKMLTMESSKTTMVEDMLASIAKFSDFMIRSGAATPMGAPNVNIMRDGLSDQEASAGAKDVTTAIGFRDGADEKTQRSNEAEIRDKVRELELKAAEKNAQTADKFAAAVDRMGSQSTHAPAGGSRPPQRT